MTNVHRLVVPRRDETRRTQTERFDGTGEVLILPCIRYERMDAHGGQGGRRAPSPIHDPVRQDLTA